MSLPVASKLVDHCLLLSKTQTRLDHRPQDTYCPEHYNSLVLDQVTTTVPVNNSPNMPKNLTIASENTVHDRYIAGLAGQRLASFFAQVFSPLWTNTKLYKTLSLLALSQCVCLHFNSCGLQAVLPHLYSWNDATSDLALAARVFVRFLRVTLQWQIYVIPWLLCRQSQHQMVNQLLIPTGSKY